MSTEQAPEATYTSSVGETSQPLTTSVTTKSVYNYNDFVDQLENYADDMHYKNVNLDKLKLVSDSNSQRDIIWGILTTQYSFLTNMVVLLDSELKKNKSVFDEKNKQVKTLEELFKKNSDVNSTFKRSYELNKYTYDKKQSHIEFFKVCLITLGVLIIIPILRYFELITKGMGFILFFFAVILTIMYGVYMIKIDDKNRDTKTYDKYVFETPTQKDVYKRLLNSADSDKHNCNPNGSDTVTDRNLFNKYIDNTDSNNSTSQSTEQCN